MSRLIWDQTGEKLYETGTKRGVLYVSLGVVPEYSTESTYGKGEIVSYEGKKYRSKVSIISPGVWNNRNWEEYKSDYCTGVPWNGLTAVTESIEGGEATNLYADDMKYLSMRSAEEFKITIEAYTYPDEWLQCDGTSRLLEDVNGVYAIQQRRRMFAFCYSTVMGNDILGNDYGEKIHIVYSATASPSEKAYASINDSPEAVTFSWECDTIPIEMPNNLKRAAEITIDSTKLSEKGKEAFSKLKEMLYGTLLTDPFIPTPDVIFELFGETVNFRALRTHDNEIVYTFDKDMINTLQ